MTLDFVSPPFGDQPILNYGPVLYHMTSFNGGSLCHQATHSPLPLRCSPYDSPSDLPHAYLVFIYLCGFSPIHSPLYPSASVLFLSVRRMCQRCVILMYICCSGSRVELQFDLVLSLLNLHGIPYCEASE